MKIKSLHMQGFKSFGDRTELHFTNNIVGVVGPNGCGKSNIVDAIRWVMGEQSAKGLRGNEMQDVIFNGTTERKKAQFAEVSLVFENGDHSAPAPYQDCAEIMITRRLYRSGESEYLINKVQARLKDITDLFLGTGSSARAYSIVAQGKVDQVVLAKPEERRFLLEEAAGIAKYKARRQAAERKMDQTKQNLDRVNDILTELERNARYLDRQVERAAKYRKLQTELRRLDEQIISAEATQLDRKAVVNEDDFKAAQASFEVSSVKLSKTEAEIETARLQALNAEKLSTSEYESLIRLKEEFSEADKRKELAEQRVQTLENQIREREKDLERLQAKSLASSEAAKKILEDQARLEAEKIVFSDELKTLKNEVDETQRKLDAKRIELDERRKLVEISTAERIRKTQKLESLKSQQVKIDAEVLKMETLIIDLEKDGDRLKSSLESSTKAREVLMDQSRSLQIELEAVQARILEGEELKKTLEKELAQLTERKIESEAQIESLETLEEHAVGYDPFVLERRNQSGLPLVMDLIRFKPEYQKIGASFLSTFGQLFVDLAAAKDLLDGQRISVLKSGAQVPFDGKSLWDLLEDEKPYQLESFLKSIEVVSVHESESSNRIQIDFEGTIRVPLGSEHRLESFGILERRSTPFGRAEELRELKETLQSLEIQMGSMAEQLKTLSTVLVEAGSSLKSIQQRIQANRQEEVVRSKEIVRIQTQLESFDARRSEMANSLIGLRDQRLVLSEEMAAVEASLVESDTGISIDDLKGEVNIFASQKEKLDQLWLEKRIAFGALEERLARMIDQTIQAEITQSEYGHNTSIYQSDINQWRQEIFSESEIKSTLSEKKSLLEGQIKDLEISLAENRRQLNRVRSDLDQLEVLRKTEFTERDEFQKIVQNLELERQTLKHRIEELAQVVAERYHIGLHDLLQTVTESDLERLEDETVLRALEVEAIELRGQLEKFGEVNLLALSEYEEISKRLTFMTGQKEDLLRTLDALQSIIDRINKITEFRFQETFKAINHNFQVLFPKLFGGGRAFMSLTNEQDMLETGVEIFAEPPGKKVQAMSLLSGGEKALTSISLLFALFAYRPASFCILDEVDAPLDEVNTTRYSSIIREMAGLSQFIVITHNKRTMEVADTLFGVTMQEPGVSQIVGVQVHEAKAFVATA